MTRRTITAHNWGKPAHIGESFQRVQSLFPTIRIRRGEGSPSDFRDRPLDFTGMHYIRPDGRDATLHDMLERTHTDAFVVVRRGDMLMEHYANGMQRDSHHLMNSVTKTFIGMLTGICIERGCLAAEDPVIDYLPELAHSAFRGTTVRTALDMTAAVRYDEEYANPEADFWRETSVVGWRPALVREGDPGDLLEYAATLRDTDQAEGERFHYRTVLTNILGFTLERATGERLETLIARDIWQKLRPENDASIVADRRGFPYVGAGMSATARDLARFGQLIADNGRIGDEAVISQIWIDDTRYADASAKRAFAATDYAAAMPGGHYRNQSWVLDAGAGLLLAIGIHGQTIFINMTTGVVIVKFSSQPASLDRDLFADTFAAMRTLSETV